MKKIQLGYCLSGEEHQETILFLHGLGSNFSQFQTQYDYFKDRYRILAISFSNYEALKLSTFAEEIIKLLKILKLQNIHFVGHSMGGNIGYELLNINQDLFLSFTVFGTTAELNKSKVELYILKLLYHLLPLYVIAKIASFSGENSESKREIFKLFLSSNKKAILNLLSQIYKFNYLHTIRESHLKSLLIIGEKDKEIRGVLDTTILAINQKENCSIIELKNAGHFCNLDNPLEFNAILDDFLSS